MTNDERAAAWTKMTKSQRMAFIKQGAALTTSGSERMAAVAKLKKQAGGS